MSAYLYAIGATLAYCVWCKDWKEMNAVHRTVMAIAVLLWPITTPVFTIVSLFKSEVRS